LLRSCTPVAVRSTLIPDSVTTWPCLECLECLVLSVANGTFGVVEDPTKSRISCGADPSLTLKFASSPWFVLVPMIRFVMLVSSIPPLVLILPVPVLGLTLPCEIGRLNCPRFGEVAGATGVAVRVVDTPPVVDFVKSPNAFEVKARVTVPLFRETLLLAAALATDESSAIAHGVSSATMVPSSTAVRGRSRVVAGIRT
jgi:hypothetical protein